MASSLDRSSLFNVPSVAHSASLLAFFCFIYLTYFLSSTKSITFSCSLFASDGINAWCIKCTCTLR
ncbi:hypothetical protein CC79DRAFT_564830 [Sarocladium strictum]